MCYEINKVFEAFVAAAGDAAADFADAAAFAVSTTL